MSLSRAVIVLALICAALASGCGGDETAPAGGTAGTLGLDDGTCQPAGIPPEMCAAGFEPDGKQGCEPILPPKPCPKGQMAVPGEASCRPVMPCPPGKWGELPVDEATEHVDGSYAGGDSDGSAAKPWTTIGEAVKAAAPGALVAVAAGTYTEDVLIKGKAVRLWGVCSEKVTIAGTEAEFAAVYIWKGASGSELGALAVTGGAIGVASSGSKDVLIDRVWVHDTARKGIFVKDQWGPTSLALRGSLVELNHNTGVFVDGSDATVEGTVVRGTLPKSDNTFGRGIGVEYDPDTGARATLTLRASLIEQNHDIGVFVVDSDATIEGAVVRDTLPRASDELLGRGIQVQVDRDTGKRVTLVLRGSLVEQNHDTGVFVSGSDATIEGTVVRGTLPRPSDQLLGLGIQVQDDPDAGERATLTLRGSIVEQNHDIGVFVYGSDATIEGCRIANTVPNMLGPFGHGIQASDSPTTGERATLTLRGSLVEHNHALGVLVTGSDATVEGTVVRDSLPQASDQLLGRGIDVQYDPDAGERATLVLRGSLVEQSHEAGVFVVDSDATIDGCRIVHTLPNHFGRFGDGLVVAGLPAQPASARVVATRIEQSARAALSNFGASMTHGSTLMQCQSFDLEGEPNGGSNFSFDHLGGSLCGCPVADRECAVLSAGLDPPDLAEPSTPTR